MKFAESALIEQVIGQPPVILLDDVMSELDSLRRDYLLHRLTGRQIFITCCDPGQVSGVDALFEMKQGCLTGRRPWDRSDGMFLHLGQNTVVRTDAVIGIFDIETASIGKITRPVSFPGGGGAAGH